MVNGLNTLGVDLADADIFVTHFHADHFSLVPKLKTPSTRIYFNRLEAELLENWQGFGAMLENADHNGFPKSMLKSALEEHPGSKFGVEWAPDATILSEGKTLTYGDYTFTCVETPGHTLGHICLYEANRKIFISGDHILIDITPNIQCWTDHENPLKNYMESLKKVRGFDVEFVLPGHRRLFTNLKSRADELISHHEDRLNEILNILDQGPKTAYETAKKMHWDIKALNWESFPIAQQWFATGEALSHLRYLEANGKINRRLVENKTQFESIFVV
jgi:glyoxylase-like metal-dependent hydrolase (beta-lactamase superfamily II)